VTRFSDMGDPHPPFGHLLPLAGEGARRADEGSNTFTTSVPIHEKIRD